MRLVLNVDDDYDVFGFAETGRIVKEAGFDAIDRGLFDMKDPSHALNGPKWQEAADEMKNAYLAHDLPIVQTHAPFKFAGMEDPTVFKDQIYPIIVRSIEVSAALGAKCVVVHPLHHIPYYENRDKLFDMNMQFYRSLIPVAKSNGIKIAVENMFQRDKLRGNYVIDSTCSRPDEFCKYIDTLDSEYIVACLDIGHTTLISGNADASEFIRILGRERLQTLHIHDNDLKNDRHVIPFSGKVDWYQVAKALGEIDYTGDWVYECLMNRCVNKLTPSMYPVVLDYMVKIGRHLIDEVEKNRKI